MKPLTPVCVLFDLDGTLLDTAPDLGAALNRLRRERDQSELRAGHHPAHGIPRLAGDAKAGFWTGARRCALR